MVLDSGLTTNPTLGEAAASAKAVPARNAGSIQAMVLSLNTNVVML